MKLGRFQFSYNAVQNKDRRQAPQTRVKHEGEVLKPSDRRKMLSTAQDQNRNLSLIAWMVRRHLDYVSRFHVSFRTGKEELDKLVNNIFKWHGAPKHFDYLRRFGRNEMFRLYELEKVISGDAGLLKLDDLKLQAIESDLIAKGVVPEKDSKGNTLPAAKRAALKAAVDKANDSGLVVDDDGGVLQYAICQRGKNGAKPIFDHLEDRDNLIFDGYWSRFSSQSRGVSPLSTAINIVQDIYEGVEFNLIKAKLHALFGIAIMRSSPVTGDMGGAGGATAETADASATATDTELDLNPRAVNVLDMQQGDDAKILESQTPSTQFVEGNYLFIQIAMLALDIPITAFDSRRSSFSARIADLNEYEVSCDHKREKNQYARKDYSDWVLDSIWNDPRSEWRLTQTAQAAGLTLRDVQEALEWIPAGSPWMDKLKQVKGDELGIALALDNSIDAARRRGSDVFRNIDKQSEVLAYAELKGVPLKTGAMNDRVLGDGDVEEIADAMGESDNE